MWASRCCSGVMRGARAASQLLESVSAALHPFLEALGSRVRMCSSRRKLLRGGLFHRLRRARSSGSMQRAVLSCAALLSRRSELCSPTLLAPRRLCAVLRLRVSLAAAHLRCRGGRSLDVKAAKHELSRTRE